MRENPKLKETHLRTALKTVSYRVVGTTTTTLMAWSVTGDMSVALTIGAMEPVIKTVVYYLHERAWQQLPRGSLRGLLRRAR